MEPAFFNTATIHADFSSAEWPGRIDLCTVTVDQSLAAIIEPGYCDRDVFKSLVSHLTGFAGCGKFPL